MSDTNQYAYGGAPLDQVRLPGGAPLGLTYKAMTTTVTVTGGLWGRLLTVPFVCARNSILFVTVNFCGSGAVTSGAGQLCRMQLVAALDATTSLNAECKSDAAGAGSEWTGDRCLINKLAADSITLVAGTSVWQIQGNAMLTGIEPGPHVLTIDGRAQDTTTVGSGSLTVSGVGAGSASGLTVIIEEYAVGL